LFDANREHVLFWMGVVNNPPGGSSCAHHPHWINFCWIQAGHGIGNISGQVQANLAAYWERNDAYLYQVNWRPDLGLPQNTQYTVHDSQTFDINGLPIFNAWVWHGRWDVLGQASLFSRTNMIDAVAEMWSDPDPTFVHCPRIDIHNAYQYFGTNGTGTSTSTWRLRTYNGTPPRWSTWVSSVTRWHNYENGVLHSNGSFRTRGGSD
jgi:hypothetical protein